MGLNSNYMQTSIRLPKEVHADLKKVCFKNGNSLNQEMLLRIVQHEGLIKKTGADNYQANCEIIGDICTRCTEDCAYAGNRKGD